MEKLTKKINEITKDNQWFSELLLPEEIRNFHIAGVNFSMMALNTYSGKLLKRALNISIAIAEFSAEFSNTKKNK